MRIPNQGPIQAYERIARQVADAPANVEREATEATEATNETTGFADALANFAQDVNEAQVSAESASQDFAEGRSDDIHGTMIQLQQADIKLRLLGNVRNRALEAYREIMRMGA